MSCKEESVKLTGTVADSLRALPLFQSVGEGELALFTHAARRVEHPKGKVLFIHGEEAFHFYVVVKGWVKLFRETLDGAQAVIDVLTQGHIVGETAVFEGGQYGFSAECVEPVELIMLPTTLLKSAIEGNQRIALNMLGSMSAHRKHQNREIEHLNLQNAPQRIGCFLLRLCPDNPPTNSITLTLPYDKTLIAARLGMKPETFSRALAKLKAETAIEIQGPNVIIHDLQGLVKYTCNYCSSEFPCKEE
jgi:CRP-like cAMP-binding protein